MAQFVVDIEQVGWDSISQTFFYGPFEARPSDEYVARLVDYSRPWWDDREDAETFLYGCDVRTREEFDRRRYSAEKIIPPPF